MTTITAIKSAVANGWSLYEGQTVDVDDRLAEVLCQTGIARLAAAPIAETYSMNIVPGAVDASGTPLQFPTQKRVRRNREAAPQN